MLLSSDAVQWAVLAIIVPILSALALLRTFRALAFTSILGDVAIVSGTGHILLIGRVH